MEKAFSVVHRDLRKLFWRKSFLFRDIVSDDGNEGRLVPLAAVWDGGQIGGVRLQRILSGGVMARASRTLSDFRNVDMPLKDSMAPRSSHLRASVLVSAKEWIRKG